MTSRYYSTMFDIKVTCGVTTPLVDSEVGFCSKFFSQQTTAQKMRTLQHSYLMETYNMIHVATGHSHKVDNICSSK